MELITLYHYDNNTGEFLYTTEPYKGSELPLYSTNIAPPDTRKNEAAIFDGKKWHICGDFRNEIYYEKATGLKIVINKLGVIDADLTPSSPKAEDDIWDGSQWIPCPLPTKAQHIDEAKKKKQAFIVEANAVIALLQDAVELRMATDEEVTQLNAWKQYRVLLNRVDASTAPNIDWPQKP
ncbi:tail fiber assembly protein [Providencia rettgeri]